MENLGEKKSSDNPYPAEKRTIIYNSDDEEEEEERISALYIYIYNNTRLANFYILARARFIPISQYDNLVVG